MKRFLVVFIVSVLGLSACQEKKVKAVDPRLATDTLKIHFQPTRKEEVALIPVAQQAIKGWENFPELEAQINALDTVNISYLRANGEEWISNMSLVQTKVGDSIANNAMHSRLTVLFSKVNTVIQEASKIEVDTAAVNKEATEFYNAFQNLKLQINLKFQKSIDELLEEYEIEADSLSAVRDSTQTRRDSLLRANRVPVN